MCPVISALGRKLVHTMICFHEDDYCQVEVLPSECLTWCLGQMEEIEKFSTAHWNGSGWDKMMVREPAKMPISDRRFTMADIKKWLCPPHIVDKDVYTGYSTHREKCPSVIAIQSDQESCLFVSENESVVDAVWMCYGNAWGSSKYKESLIGFLGSNNLIVADWSSGCVIGPSKLDFDKYESRFQK